MNSEEKFYKMYDSIKLNKILFDSLFENEVIKSGNWGKCSEYVEKIIILSASFILSYYSNNKSQNIELFDNMLEDVCFSYGDGELLKGKYLSYEKAISVLMYCQDNYDNLDSSLELIRIKSKFNMYDLKNVPSDLKKIFTTDYKEKIIDVLNYLVCDLVFIKDIEIEMSDEAISEKYFNINFIYDGKKYSSMGFMFTNGKNVYINLLRSESNVIKLSREESEKYDTLFALEVEKDRWGKLL